MCESNIYNTDGQLLMENVMEVSINDNEISMIDILNNVKIIQGKFIKLELENHKMIIEEK